MNFCHFIKVFLNMYKNFVFILIAPWETNMMCKFGFGK